MFDSIDCVGLGDLDDRRRAAAIVAYFDVVQSKNKTAATTTLALEHLGTVQCLPFDCGNIVYLC